MAKIRIERDILRALKRYSIFRLSFPTYSLSKFCCSLLLWKTCAGNNFLRIDIKESRRKKADPYINFKGCFFLSKVFVISCLYFPVSKKRRSKSINSDKYKIVMVILNPPDKAGIKLYFDIRKP